MTDRDSTQGLVEAFKKGTVLGLEEPSIQSPQHIQTFISDVFLFPTTVYKIYRKDNEPFNRDFTDLSDPETRKVFYREDFKWNQYFNASVYQRLRGIEARNGTICLTEEKEDSFDRVIQMRRIDTTANLTKLLVHKQISPNEIASLGYQLTKSIDAFPWRGPQTMPILTQLEIMMRDVEAWARLADPVFPHALTDKVMHCLRGYIQSHAREFNALTDEEYVIGMDNHSDNVFFENGELSLIDIYPPKRDWRFIERSYSIYRLSTDIEILGGKTLAEAFIAGCTRYPTMKRLLRPEKRWFYQLYSALIRAPYLYFLIDKNPERKAEAELFKTFIEQSIRA